MFTCTFWGGNIYILKHIVLYLNVIAPDVGLLDAVCRFVIKKEHSVLETESFAAFRCTYE
jgi:hypothetical protein